MAAPIPWRGFCFAMARRGGSSQVAARGRDVMESLMRINSKLCGTILGFALLTAGPVYAAAISGSDTVGASVTSTNETGGNLGTSTTVTLSSIFETFSVLAPGAGSFGVIPLDTTVPL